MQPSPTRLNSPLVVTLIVMACAGLTLVFLKLASEVLAPIFLAATLAVLFSPILRWLERKGLPDTLALVVIIAGVIVLVVVLVFIVYSEANELADRIPYYAELLQKELASLTQMLDAHGIDVQDLFPTDWINVQELAKAALSFLTSAISGGVTLIFFLFTLILLLADSKRIGSQLRRGVSADNRILIGLTSLCLQIQTQYRIQALSNFLSAGALTLEFLVFQIDFALLWGILAFPLGFIPNIGLILACLPAVLLAFILHGPATALAVVAIGIVLNAAMDNLVTPRFMHGGLNLPIAVTFISFLFWSWVFGFLGALLAIPATLLVRTLLRTNNDTLLASDLLSAETKDSPPTTSEKPEAAYLEQDDQEGVAEPSAT